MSLTLIKSFGISTDKQIHALARVICKHKTGLISDESFNKRVISIILIQNISSHIGVFYSNFLPNNPWLEHKIAGLHLNHTNLPNNPWLEHKRAGLHLNHTNLPNNPWFRAQESRFTF